MIHHHSRFILKILVFLFLISNSIYPQWNIQYSQSGDWLTSVHFFDYNNGWAVGGRFTVGALILKTTDGGTNWDDNLTIPGSVNLFESVYFTNENTGWVVGGGGLMMMTTNSGNTWDTVAVPTDTYLHQIIFIDANNGWVVGTEDNLTGGIILRTTDGGANWERIDISAGNLFLSVSFLNQDFGWGVGSEIQKTTDGGINWVTINDSTQGGSGYFTDELNGWVVGASDLGPYGFIHKTTDGGYNWSSISGPDIPGLFDVNFFDKNIGWAVGSGTSGAIIKTTDGGENWFHQESGTVNSFNSVYIIDSVTGWTAGIGSIFKTTNGGVTFINEDETEEMPTNFSLSQNYPNPFNPSTTIRWQLPESSNVTLKIFNTLGEEIITLVDEYQEHGKHSTFFIMNSTLTSGVYFYQLKTDGYVETKKMILLR
ncbi:YCF48-related protein [Bacteroidota bacterium]